MGKLGKAALCKVITGFLVISLVAPIGIFLLLGEDASAEDIGQFNARQGWPMERGNPQRNGTSSYTVSELKPHVLWDVDLTKMAGWNKNNRNVSTVLTSVAEDGTIYLANSENVSAIYPNGTLRWTIGLTDTPYMGSAVGRSGDLYIGTIGHRDATHTSHSSVIYAISPNGSIRWRLQLPEINPMPLLVDESNTIFASVYGFECVDQYNITVTSNVLVAIAPNGSIMWKYSIPVTYTKGGACVPAVAPDGTIRFQTENTLVAINRNGSTKWSIDLPSRTPYELNYPLVTNNGSTIIICNQTLMSIDSEGGLQWSYDFQLTIDSYSRWLIYANKMIYLYNAGWPDFLVAVRDNGTPAWTIYGDGYSHYGPAMSQNGLILILKEDARLEAIAANGTKVWESEPLYATSSSAGPTEIVIGADDRIYLRHFTLDQGMPGNLIAVGYKVEQPIISAPQTWLLIGLGIIAVAAVGSFLIWRRSK